MFVKNGQRTVNIDVLAPDEKGYGTHKVVKIPFNKTTRVWEVWHTATRYWYGSKRETPPYPYLFGGSQHATSKQIIELLEKFNPQQAQRLVADELFDELFDD
jgi:hypothetical protein